MGANECIHHVIAIGVCSCDDNDLEFCPHEIQSQRECRNYSAAGKPEEC